MISTNDIWKSFKTLFVEREDESNITARSYNLQGNNMPISFKVKAKNGYFVSRYQGHISDAEHRLAFDDFLTGNEWIPGMSELAIASNAVSSSISYISLRSLSAFKNRYYEEHKIMHVKIAIYAPGDLAFGIARMYDMVADESPEEVKAFRDVRKAIRWLRQ